MTNSTGFTTLVALALQRDCFVSEQDRLAEYAKSLRVPIQAGEIIKGDKGDKGEDGDRGPQGNPGDDGAPGADAELTTVIVEIPNGVEEVTVSGDIRDRIINLYYDDQANDPPSLTSIMCLRYNGTDTIVYLGVITPDDKFRLSVSGFV